MQLGHRVGHANYSQNGLSYMPLLQALPGKALPVYAVGSYWVGFDRATRSPPCPGHLNLYRTASPAFHRLYRFRQYHLSIAAIAASGMAGIQPRNKPPVVIITTVGCQFCKLAKDVLKQEAIEYEEIEAGNQLKLLDEIKAMTGKRSVPQVTMLRSACSVLQLA